MSAPGARAVASRSVVAIDGPDGSGKSHFAEGLVAAVEAAGGTAVLLRVDDFRVPIDFEGGGAARELSRYYDDYYDFAALDRALSAFLGGAADGAIAIVEGVLVLRATLPAETPLIVLEVSLQVARRRILERDRAKGRSPQEIARRIERRYLPAQARYRAAFDPLARADVLVDNDDWTSPRVLRRADGRFPPPVAAGLARLLPPG